MKIKRLLKIFIIFIALALPVVILIYAASKKEDVLKSKHNRKTFTLHDLKLFKKDGSLYPLNDLDADKNTVLILFSPDCDMCREELKNIADHFDQFEQKNVFFIGPNNQETYDFLTNKPYELLKKKNVKMVHDKEGILFKDLKIRSTPAILVFDQTTKIKKIYEGVHPLDSLQL